MSVTIKEAKKIWVFQKTKLSKIISGWGNIIQRMFEEIVYVELEYRKIIRYSY